MPRWIEISTNTVVRTSEIAYVFCSDNRLQIFLKGNSHAIDLTWKSSENAKWHFKRIKGILNGTWVEDDETGYDGIVRPVEDWT